MKIISRNLLIFSVLTVLTFPVSAKSGGDGKFNPKDMIMHHIQDSHEWHIATLKNDDGSEKHISIPLPVILYTDDGLKFFMSGPLYHNPDNTHEGFKLHHEHIYYADGKAVGTARRPIDFSITKNVASMMLASLLLILIFTLTASAYKKRKGKAPKGLQNAMESLVIFVRDEIAVPNIGEEKYRKYFPYILTVFFFVWVNNLLGLIPTGANASGNIAFTLTLAVFTALITNFSGNAHYWKHIFWTPGVPLPLRIIMLPVELIGILTKPFALMIRLFANITAGHIIILSLLSFIFIFESYAVGIPAGAFVIIMTFLELFVAALQAYIFALLSALFIGLAVEEHSEQH